MAIANIYDGEARELAVGHISAMWRDPGREAGTRELGLRRIEVAEGHFSTPAHEHGREEEIFFVLGGEGLLWQNGSTWLIGAGDVIVHRPKRGVHTLRAGSGGLDVLVFGQRCDPSLTAVPRAGVAWSYPRWVSLPDGDSPFAREAAAGPPECPPPSEQRPRNLLALADVPALFEGRTRRAGQAAGALATGLNHVTLAANGTAAPAHCHSAEEELFVVLDGSGVLQLWPRGGGEPESQPLRAGDVVSRPAGTGVAHALHAAGSGLTYLAYGSRASNDMCFYPQSGRVALRGLGIALRSPEIEHLPGP